MHHARSRKTSRSGVDRRARRPGPCERHTRVPIVATVSAACVVLLALGTRPLAAQDTAMRRLDASTEPTVAAPGHGPAFLTDTAADGQWVDASTDPRLKRRVSLTLIGVPLAPAVQGIVEKAGLDVAFNQDDIPFGARVSMQADDVTVAAALTWVLTNARLDVLIDADGHLTLVPHATAQASVDSSGVMVGSVVDITTGEVVPYATVLLLGTERARFATADGRFRLAGLAAGTYRVRARQIGYAPMDTTVAITQVPSVVSIALHLRRIPAVLGLVSIIGHEPPQKCVATGVPDSTADPALATIFSQVRENVDRNRLLLDQYPFRYLREERRSVRRDPGGDSLEYIDTLAFDSRARHPYRVGGVVFYALLPLVHRVDTTTARPDSRRPGVSKPPRQQKPGYSFGQRMYVPTFRDLADSAFLAAHCFTLGEETADSGGRSLLRIDFKPATEIHVPDVEGAIYLDAQRLIVRRAVFALTNAKAADPPVLGMTVTSTFREMLPLVPLVDTIQSVQPLPSVKRDKRSVNRVSHYSDHTIGMAFERASPGSKAVPLRQ